MKKKILLFLAGIVTTIAVAVAYIFLQRKSEGEAFEKIANKDLKENLDKSYEEFDKEHKELKDEITKAKVSEIRRQVHSLFGLDS